MRCQQCDYRLWNLPSRLCPECGTPFRPSDFEFTPNSVQFCCPHCNQDYYGTNQKGHLVPPQFDCIRCGQRIDMDQMVLRPTAGVEEDRTRLESHPWLDRHEIGWFTAWFKTVGAALGTPGKLMRAGTPGRGGDALLFAAGSNFIYYTVGLSLMAALIGLVTMIGFGGRGLVPSWGSVAGFFMVWGLSVAGFVAAVIVISLLWGLCTHLLLKLGGRPQYGLGRTFEALWYSSGANAFAAVPYLGQYFFFVGLIWWMISAVLMVKDGQRVSGGRASFAVLTPPLTIGLLAFVAATIAWTVAMSSALGGFGAVGAIPTTSPMPAALRNWAAQNNGAGPPHAIQLAIDGQVTVSEFVDDSTLTWYEEVPIGDVTVETWDELTPDQQAVEAQRAIAALPANVVAHRLGDYVFTYHGINFTSAPPNLWTVIHSPDPDANPGAAATPQWYLIGQVDGISFPIPAATLPQQLQLQNALRQQQGLPPLPDPATVTHAQPATDGP